ncbi:hypothetical protein COMNV_00396 [Commensalibacter sp. Nvir]|uniref:YihY/virulence factor BrkB family protein n=1 Tax=Commensalibacter sp. Nvir TaxID=3069817 RepID=UPI002D27FD38|nr:hypothetical protein COMNV_00396 [Commensalibacter sp. Nvir]
MDSSADSSKKVFSLDRNCSPLKISIGGWFEILKNTIMALINGPSTLVSAGCAFFSTLSLFPTASSLISIYGLLFDPQTVEPQLKFLSHFLPPSVYQFLQQMIKNLVEQTNSTLTTQLVISILLALWASAIGTKGLITGLNITYNVEEARNFFKFQVVSFTLTLFAILGMILTLAIVVALPAIINTLPLKLFYEVVNFHPIVGQLIQSFNIVRTSSNLVVLFFIMGIFALFYRYGPCRNDVKWRWIFPGVIASTFLSLVSALLFSFYVAHLANFTSTYGPLGTIAAVMMWFWVSCYVVLLGAQFNAKIEEYVMKNSFKIQGPT